MKCLFISISVLLLSGVAFAGLRCERSGPLGFGKYEEITIQSDGKVPIKGIYWGKGFFGPEPRVTVSGCKDRSSETQISLIYLSYVSCTSGGYEVLVAVPRAGTPTATLSYKNQVLASIPCRIEKPSVGI